MFEPIRPIMVKENRVRQNVPGRTLLPAPRERLTLALLLLATFALRAWKADQPIVENYVGRQIPTAMAARNLDRGSGFLRPTLDTGPFPNLFLVEPPVFALLAVGLQRASGLPLEPSGRLVSALGVALGAWGLFGLAQRREGGAVALIAVVSFALFPVTIRYGRAFQPDALMLGLLLAGLRCWDDHEHGEGPGWLVAGWTLLALGLSLKVVSAYVLIPLLLVIVRPRTPWKVALAVATLAPALLWYVHAWSILAGEAGSRASAENAAIWGRVLVPTALFNPGMWFNLVRSLTLKAFTPLGTLLAAWGFTRGVDRLWRVWGVSASLAMLALAGKLHHEYYWLALAPLAALGMGKGLVDLAGRGVWGRSGAVLAATGFAALSAALSASTWTTPPEWAALPEAAEAIGRHTPADALVVAPEALLYAADRRGCRLETGAGPARRAVSEWGGSIDPADPLALIEFYQGRGARFVADVYDGTNDPRRPLHDALRRRYPVLVDRPGVFLAALLTVAEPNREEAAHAARRARANPRDPARLRPLESRGAEDRRAHGLRLHDGPTAR